MVRHDLHQCLRNFPCVTGLADQPSHARREDFPIERRIGQGGNDHHGEVRKPPAQFGKQGKAVAAGRGHAEVRDQGIARGVVQQREQLVGRLCFADDGGQAIFGQRQAKAFEHDGVIVGQDNAVHHE